LDQEKPETVLELIKLEFLKLKSRWRIVSFLVAVVFTSEVLRVLPKMTAQDSYLNVTIAWMVALLAYVLAMTPKITQWRYGRSWWQAHQAVAFAVGTLILLAFLLRVWHVGKLPFTLAGDEGAQGVEAVKVIKGLIRNPFTTGWTGVPTMSFFFNSITMRLFGQTTVALRLPWVLVGTVTVWVTFCLVKQIKGTRLALATAALLATYHYHIHFSRLGSNQIADPLFLSLALFFLYQAIDRDSNLLWSLTGSTVGLAFYFYAGARLTPIVVILVLSYFLVTERLEFWNSHKIGMIIALGAFLVAAAPMIQLAIRFPNNFNSRINEIGIIQSGWLARETEIRGVGIGAILLDQFRRATLAFNYYPDRTVWYGLQQPLLDPLFGFLFIVGLVFSSLRSFDKRVGQRLIPMVVWWWSGMILGGMLTVNPPSSQRLITLAVPVCFFIALAGWEIIQLAGNYMDSLPANALLFMLVLAFGAISLKTYFIEFTPQRLYGGRHAELATEIAPFLNKLSQDYRFYFFGPPEMFWEFGTIQYLSPRAEGVDMMNPITSQDLIDLAPSEKGSAFIFLPARMDELSIVQAAYPNGEKREFFSPLDEQLMVTLYILPPQQ